MWKRRKRKTTAKAKAKAKGKAAVVDGIVEVIEDAEEVLLASKQISEDLMKAANLKKLAELTYNQGSVPFYGCSKCRYQWMMPPSEVRST